MEGLSVQQLRETNPKQFNYKLWASYMKNAPAEAQKYMESFKTQVQPKQEIITETQTNEVVQTTTEEEKTPKNETILITKEDEKQLRKMYEEKAWKKAYGWRNWEELVKRINNLPPK